MNRTEIAEVCYRAHQAYCSKLGEELPPWEKFPYRDRVARCVDLCLGVPSSHVRDQSPELVRDVVTAWFTNTAPTVTPAFPPRNLNGHSLTDRRKIALFVGVVWSLAAAQ